MKFTADYSEPHVLPDGSVVVVRPIRPDDADELRRAFSRLSPESRYRRFLSATSTLTDEMVHYLTNVDGVDHFALVAFWESPDLKEESGVGVARYIRLHGEPDVAEAAVTVIDSFQKRGLGKLLTTSLAEAARERGIDKFRGEVLASNLPMRHLLAEVGAVEVLREAETIVFDISIASPSGELVGVNALQRLLRATAETMAIMVRAFRDAAAWPSRRVKPATEGEPGEAGGEAALPPPTESRGEKGE